MRIAYARFRCSRTTRRNQLLRRFNDGHLENVHWNVQRLDRESWFTTNKMSWHLLSRKSMGSIAWILWHFILQPCSRKSKKKMQSAQRCPTTDVRKKIICMRKCARTFPNCDKRVMSCGLRKVQGRKVKPISGVKERQPGQCQARGQDSHHVIAEPSRRRGHGYARRAHTAFRIRRQRAGWRVTFRRSPGFPFQGRIEEGVCGEEIKLE